MRRCTPQLLCRRPILSTVNPCNVSGCKQERAEGKTMCQGHIDGLHRKYLRLKERRAMAKAAKQ